MLICRSLRDALQDGAVQLIDTSEPHLQSVDTGDFERIDSADLF